ncbi:thiolase family protein [Mycobacterium gordonae]|jgi:acetyl-CoA acetyltransferase|uniref:Dioxygenase n=1 Tax=Mycobacterium gordonae TaxID=1778 RepID=A0A1A6B6F8_MYCGO|nr:thiolase family protein [Mycobacterium gordonae]MBI2702026.1 thiolase family protein [Mycobacterium sp.]MCV7007367.1 thiolase family protein [Mycobacterium gordonae]OBR97828.1 dioxygenase [Mycobacterium gordonae]ODR23589.1 dioxygenase [Mycobacterium gordonae]ORV96352.1 dioxygenase [Mycobacterium gordonae]
MASPLTERVIISGIGQSAIGRRLGRDGLALTVEACENAVVDAGLSLADIDGLTTYPGSSQPGLGFSGASLRDIHDALGLKPNWVAGGVESPGQLGAVVDAMMAVASGLADHVLCWRSIWEGTAQGAGPRRGYGAGAGRPGGMLAWQVPFGATAANLAALQIRTRMHRYGLTREQLASIAIAQRSHAAHNPCAIYTDPIDIETYLSARMISDPLCLFDCDIACDGATAFVISRAEHAGGLDHPALVCEALDCAHHDRFTWEAGQDITRISSRWLSLWERTDFTVADVDMASLYDGFSVFVLCWLEDLGFCAVGESGDWVADWRRISLGGELPINTAGGQLSGGRLHGFGHLHEACLQIRGEAGARQVDGAGLAAVGVGAANSGTTAMLLRRA